MTQTKLKPEEIAVLEWFRKEYSYDSAPKTLEAIFDSKRFTDEYYAFIAGWNKNRHEQLLRLLKEARMVMDIEGFDDWVKEVEQILKEEETK